MRPSSVSYYQFDDKTSCIIVSLPDRNDTQIINIDPLMGTLIFSGISGYDVFPTKEAAFNFITKGRTPIRTTEASSILGYVSADKCSCLILIEKAKPMFSLFEKHMVYSIESTCFIEIATELHSFSHLPPSHIQKLKNYPFAYSHFFCPTLDLSKDLSTNNHTVRCCWNQQLMKPFDQFKKLIPSFCVPVYQGIASYTPFVQYSVDVLFLGSHSFPQTPELAKPGKHYATKDGVTCNESTIDIYFIRNKKDGFEILNHLIEVGDFPFSWNTTGTAIRVGAPKNNLDMTEAFIETQSKIFGFEYISFLNYMRLGYEQQLFTTLEAVLHTVSDTKDSNSKNLAKYEQDEFEWIQSTKDEQSLDMFVRMYWPPLSTKITKFGFTKSYISNDNAITVLSKQNGVFRVVFNNTFDREILGLFFFLLKLLELMGNEYGLGFDKLVEINNIKDFGSGFTFFAGKFLIEFYYFLSNFSNLQIGDLQSYIFKFINPSPIEFSSYKIEYSILQESTYALMTTISSSTIPVSQSISSFVMSEKIGNAILKPLQNGYIGINTKEKPFVICLSEPSYLREVIFKNTNAISVTISAGLRLNETFLVAQKILLPYIQSPESKTYNPYIRINFQASNLYDYDIRPFDFEKVRFIFFKFKTYGQEPLRIGGVFVYGSLTAPLPTQPNKSLNLSLSAQNSSGTFPLSDPNLLTTVQQHGNNSPNSPKSPKQKKSQKPQKSSKSQKDKQISPKDKLSQLDKSLKVDNLLEEEKKRLERHEPYFAFQKKIIAKNIPLDRIDFETIYTPDYSPQDPQKDTCSECNTKKMCNECVNCRKKFCKKCMPNMTRCENRYTYLCKACIKGREAGINSISNLKRQQYMNIVDMYPFIAKHNIETMLDQSYYLKFDNGAQSSFPMFSDINRPPLSMFLIEPPHAIEANQKEARLMPENLFTSDIQWSINTNVVQLTVIFACESKISGLHLSCSSPLKVSIKDAVPNELRFTPPGSIQKVNLSGRLAQIIIKGDVIKLHNLRFIGEPVILPPEELYSSNSGSSTNIATTQVPFPSIPVASAQFLDQLKCHEFILKVPTEICAFKYKTIPKEIIAEFKSQSGTKYIRHKVAILEPTFDDSLSSGYLVLPTPVITLAIRIFYPRMTPELFDIYKTEIPEIVSKPKEDRKLKKV